MATKSIAWTTGTGNIILTYQGQGDGPISVQSDENDGAVRSQVITIETTAGTPVVTKNVTVSQAACPFPVGDVKNYSYTGSYQEVVLPAGSYKLQCWGAQGGSNGTNSSYGITAKAGGKGGYSEGVLTLSQKTTVRVYVGGQGSASAGGFNGGGSTTGTSQYNSSNEFGYSKMGGGGGATDIRLSDGALLSRMIVAGGGGGGAMCYKSATTSTTTNVWPGSGTSTKNIWPSSGWVNGTISGGQDSPSNNRCRSVLIDTSDVISFSVKVNSGWKIEVDFYADNGSSTAVWDSDSGWLSSSTTISAVGKSHGYVKFLFAKTDNSNVSPSQYSSAGSVSVTYSQNWTNKIVSNSGYESYNGIRALTKNYIDINGATSISVSANSGWNIEIEYYNSSYSFLSSTGWTTSGTYTPPSNARYIKILYKANPEASINLSNSSSVGSVSKTVTSTTTSTDSQVGYVGGGSSGGGYSDTYKGRQNAAGSGGSFGTGAPMSTTGYRYCSGAGGGGWYGGGCAYSDSTMSYVRYMGGGSGWVNTSASASNRPSGYTGLQLDSGETKAGNTSFPSTSGGNETGHAGNGYARITRLS